MEFSDTILQNLVGFLSGLIGAVVGGLFTLYATNKTIRQENEKENRQEEKEVQNLLQALSVEVGALWGFHMGRVGAMVENLEEGKDAIEFYYPLTQDYFTVYNENAGKIGKIPDAALREVVVTCYNKCKKVVDGFKYNNELYLDYRNTGNILSDDPKHQQLVAKKKELLVQYAIMIKEDHFILKNYIEKMLNMITVSIKETV